MLTVRSLRLNNKKFVELSCFTYNTTKIRYYTPFIWQALKEISRMANRRRNSYAEIAVNPFESGVRNEKKLELVSDSIPITSDLFAELLTELQTLSNPNGNR
jgi:hypothetical protein